MATNHSAHIKSTTETLSGDLSAHLTGANRSITSWIAATREAGAEDVAKELENLHNHIEGKDYAHVATSLTKLGKLTHAAAAKDESLEALAKALTDAGHSLSGDAKKSPATAGKTSDSKSTAKASSK